MDDAISVNGIPIRISAERWRHIVENRDELAGRFDDVILAIEEPDWVTRGYRGALMAWKGYGRRGYLVAVYKEQAGGKGFLVTAFFTRKAKKGDRVWP